MGLFKKLFGKKTGGTKLGNLFRGVANKINKNWGTGKNMKQVPDETQEGSLVSNTTFQTGSQVGDWAMNQASDLVKNALIKNDSNDHTVTGGIQDVIKTVVTDGGQKYAEFKVTDWLKNNWYWLLLPAGLLLYFVFRGRKKR